MVGVVWACYLCYAILAGPSEGVSRLLGDSSLARENNVSSAVASTSLADVFATQADPRWVFDIKKTEK